MNDNGKFLLDLSTAVQGQVGATNGSIHLQVTVEDFDAALAWIAIQYSKLDTAFTQISFASQSIFYSEKEGDEPLPGICVTMSAQIRVPQSTDE